MVTGGPNKDFTYMQLSPPANQPPQNSYKEFNDGWPQNSWEITEPAIYYNAAYILLLSNFAKQTAVPVNEPPLPPVLSEKEVFEVFPNPAGDSFFVRFPDARLRTVQVFDETGTLIFEKQTAETQLTVELKNAPAGVYRVGVNGVLKQIVKQ